MVLNGIYNGCSVARFKCRRFFLLRKNTKALRICMMDSMGKGATKRAAISCQRSGGRSFSFSVGKYVISTATLTCPVHIPACRNPRFPDAIRKLTPITQLYISQSLGALNTHPGAPVSPRRSPIELRRRCRN